jgi:hypothetical protein
MAGPGFGWPSPRRRLSNLTALPLQQTAPDPPQIGVDGGHNNKYFLLHGALRHLNYDACMNALKFDEESTTKDRLAFQIIGQSGEEFEKHFYRLIASDSNQPLSALNPKIEGGLLTFDAVTHLPGIDEAFDTVVQQAQSIVQHENDVANEKIKIKAHQKDEVIRKFTKSQGKS